ncbi:MAG TPA: haloacid dehalogenase-like hydrolase [Streptosporangiaceae bacterium]|nr:haloacid dehalogenase-like hydrolase [Streptosporangiaceae bacterium]
MLWNIDFTLVDVGRVTRAAYAEAFRKVTGRPLVKLPQMAGRIDSEIFFDALASNGAAATAAAGEGLLSRFTTELAAAFAARREQLTEQGRLLPGAAEAVAEVSYLNGVVQSVLTGGIKQNAVEKLRAFGLDEYLDVEIGGYGSQPYPKGALLLMVKARAGDKYGLTFGEDATVYIADSARDVEAARVGGARCLAVASGRSTVSELRAGGADVVFEDLADTAAVTAAIDRLTLAAAG